MTTGAEPAPIRTRADLTDEWLADALGRPGLAIDRVEAIGTGQMSESFRIRLADGSSVVVKLASEDEGSRSTGVGMGAYAREVNFYQQLAGRVEGALAACAFAAIDADGWFTLVLEDLDGARPGDQIAGCSVEDAHHAVKALARVHAPFIGDLHAGTTPWLNQPSPLNQGLLELLLPGFLDRYDGRISPEHAAVCERFVPVVDAWAADRRAPLGLVHGDYRLDNLLFRTVHGSVGECRVVDWQTVGWGPAMIDVSYFIGSGLSIDDRRSHEHALVRAYYDELTALEGRGLDWDTCWAEYRRQSFAGLLMTIAASMVVVRTDRGDDQFMAWLARNAQQILDLDALDLLPLPGVSPPALVPDPADEGTHPPGTEDTWNESWYFDGVSDDGTVGVYVRLGRLPNRGCALYTAAIVGPDRPAVLVVDPAAVLPPADDQSQRIDQEDLVAEQRCLDPLQRFTVKLHGRGQAFDDEAAPLRAEAGTPTPVELDLDWTTAGATYQWRVATRYEIPCRVTGTIRVGDETIAFAGVGQRDHSWGSRDWWANDWMWNGLHLDDGTHIHVVTIPEVPGLGIGYVQRDGAVNEVAAATTTEEVAPDGLITTARVTIDEPATTLDIEPLAWGALRLVAPDGRVTHFPRAMCRVRTGDGRHGKGWIEWNRNQRP